jgi:hypothetical protein
VLMRNLADIVVSDPDLDALSTADLLVRVVGPNRVTERITVSAFLRFGPQAFEQSGPQWLELFSFRPHLPGRRHHGRFIG